MVSQSLQSLYDVLQVDSDATFEQIKIAFKKRALEVHPDKGGSKEGPRSCVAVGILDGSIWGFPQWCEWIVTIVTKSIPSQV